MFAKKQEYNTYNDFMNDRDNNEAVSGYGGGLIFDIITREYLGQWRHRDDNSVLVTYA